MGVVVRFSPRSVQLPGQSIWQVLQYVPMELHALEENRWGYFPSMSLGWRMSEEQFMKSLTFVDDLKLRASYGLTGNFRIPNYGEP